MFCREQVAHLKEWEPRFRAAGASLAVVGSGSVAQAAAFHKDRQLPFALYTDPSLRTFAAAGLRRGLLTAMSVGVFRNASRAMKAGFRQGATEGDPWQQGGAFVIRPDGSLLYAQISVEAGDHADPAAMLAALTAAAPAPSPTR